MRQQRNKNEVANNVSTAPFESGYISRMARSCITDANYDSYTEVTLQCNVEGRNDSYRLVQDAKIAPVGSDLAAQLGINVGSPVFVAIFAPSKGITNEPLPKSALCVYSLQDIETKFDENIHMCFNSSIKYRNMGYISGPIQDGVCPQAGVSTINKNFFHNKILLIDFQSL
jgi:plexin A